MSLCNCTICGSKIRSDFEHFNNKGIAMFNIPFKLEKKDIERIIDTIKVQVNQKIFVYFDNLRTQMEGEYKDEDLYKVTVSKGSLKKTFTSSLTEAFKVLEQFYKEEIGEK